MDNTIYLLNALVLLLVANGAPILARKLFNHRFDQPLDRDMMFLDGRPLLGPKKTYLGLIASVIMTPLAAVLLNLTAWVGVLVASLAMLGDLLSSFIKRRMGLDSSDRYLGIDQVPESLLPLWVLRDELELEAPDIFILVVAFFIVELVLSRILFRLKIRDRPH